MTAIDLRFGRRHRLTPAARERAARRTRSSAAAPVLRKVVVLDALAVIVAQTSTVLLGAEVSLIGGLVLCGLWLVGLHLKDGYHWPTVVLRPLDIGMLVSVAGWLAMALAVLNWLAGVPVEGYLWLLTALVLAFAAGRALSAAWVRRANRAGRNRLRVVARAPLDDMEATVLNTNHGLPFELVDVCPTGAATGSAAQGTAEVLDRAIERDADVILLVGQQPEAGADLRRLIWALEAEGFQVAMMPVAASITPPVTAPLGSTRVPLLLFDDRHDCPENSIRKAVIDRAVALLALIVLSPVFALIALAVRLDSPGSIFYRQVRVGQGRRPFTMYKFRTMQAGAEEMQDALAALNIHDEGTLFKIPDDPRVTRVGGLLRRFSLDELPQFFNIARGEMSLVGPRPPLPHEVANYPSDAFRRFVVRPGLTGLWQVSGRSDLDADESVRLDLYYAEHWSPWLDARIVGRTLGAVISGDGAY